MLKVLVLGTRKVLAVWYYIAKDRGILEGCIEVQIMYLARVRHSTEYKEGLCLPLASTLVVTKLRVGFLAARESIAGLACCGSERRRDGDCNHTEESFERHVCTCYERLLESN